MLPDEQTSTTVVSEQKKTWSKKQKLLGGVGSFVALVAIGVGGFAIYSNVVSNAEGEASLGSNVTTNEGTNESQYFRVVRTNQQQVWLAGKGEAEQDQGSNNGMLAQGWMIQRSTAPDDETSWTGVAGGFNGEGYYSQIGTLDKDSVESLDELNGALLAPSTTYYYRAVKRIINDDTNQPEWQPQGDVVSATTSAYPTISPKAMSGNQVTIAWTGTKTESDIIGKQESGLINLSGNLTYRIVRVDQAKNVKVAAGDIVGKLNQDVLPRSYYDNQTSKLQLDSGSVTIEQPVSSSYDYYMVLATSGSAGDRIVKVLNSFSYAANSEQGNLMYDATAPASISNIDAKNQKIKLTLKDGVDVGPNGSLSYSVSSSDGLCRADGTLNASESRSFDIPLNSSSFGSCEPNVGNLGLTITAKTDTLSQSSQLRTMVTAAAPAKITVKYLDSTVKYRKSVKIAITNPVGYHSTRALGTIRVRNLSTGKQVGSTQLVSTYKQYITLGNVKPGKYKLSVEFTPNSASNFTAKTIKLPLLTIYK